MHDWEDLAIQILEEDAFIIAPIELYQGGDTSSVVVGGDGRVSSGPDFGVGLRDILVAKTAELWATYSEIAITSDDASPWQRTGVVRYDAEMNASPGIGIQREGSGFVDILASNLRDGSLYICVYPNLDLLIGRNGRLDRYQLELDGVQAILVSRGRIGLVGRIRAQLNNVVLGRFVANDEIAWESAGVIEDLRKNARAG